ncbi:MAG TPA: glucose-6-phosphate isomerase [Campylobacterales bacterium]|nr:glucose-6-phosphate isomerase [Campylobacterales bacterium]
MQNRLYFENLDTFDREKKELMTKIEEERGTIGYYNLPKQNIDEILDFVDSFDKNIENIMVLGIGGSSLGAKAIFEFLKPMEKPKRELFFFESTDPLNIEYLLKQVDIDKTHFLVISKSGGTVETISILKYIFSQKSNKENFTFITDTGSNLDKFAQDLGSKVFYLPANVGGRFSVLSVVGLIPLALCGVDIKSLLEGANEVSDSFFNNKEINSTLLDKAIFYAKNHEKYSINSIFAYSESLKYFTEWFVQLWGESLGKKHRDSICNIGLTPIGLIGPKDQHSFLQLIMEGKRDKTVTFIKLKEFNPKLNIPAITLPHLEALDILNNISFHDLINMQCDSIIEALLNEKEIPVDKIEILAVDAKSIGGLMYYYELLTSLVGQLLGVDTYNQPGVEAGKIILKEKLSSISK